MVSHTEHLHSFLTDVRFKNYISNSSFLAGEGLNFWKTDLKEEPNHCIKEKMFCFS